MDDQDYELSWCEVSTWAAVGSFLFPQSPSIRLFSGVSIQRIIPNTKQYRMIKQIVIKSFFNGLLAKFTITHVNLCDSDWHKIVSTEIDLCFRLRIEGKPAEWCLMELLHPV
jgi:hypothetical protein